MPTMEQMLATKRFVFINLHLDFKMVKNVAWTTIDNPTNGLRALQTVTGEA